MGRKTITFPVRVQFTARVPDDSEDGWHLEERDRWLAPDGQLVEDQDQAVRFTLKRSATPAERFSVTTKMHELAGGLRAYQDLERGIQATRDAIRNDIEAELWPDGRPEVTGQDKLAQDQRFERAWSSYAGPWRDGLLAMTTLLDRLEFMASWSVLIVDSPDGWAALADKEELDEDVFGAIWGAWLDAQTASRLEQLGLSKP